MIYLEKAKEYYFQWTDVDQSVLVKPGVYKVLSKKRDEIPIGHSKAMQLWCFIYRKTIVVSYSKILQDKIDSVVRLFRESIELAIVKNRLESIFDQKIGHSYKYYFSGKQKPCDISIVKKLQVNDYLKYDQFFRKIHPHSVTTGWLEEYFIKNVEREFVYGIMKDDDLVSVTDAPDIPYMSDQIIEPGINTLKEHRKNGFAKMVCTAMLKKALDLKMIPIWGCGHENLASQKLAEGLGFIKMAEVLSISI